MANALNNGSPNPDDITIHNQVKEIADILSPELLRLHEAPQESTGDIELYERCIQQMEMIRREVANQDSLFAFHNIISLMKKSISLVLDKADNQTVLWTLQEVTAILFKIRTLPS